MSHSEQNIRQVLLDAIDSPRLGKGGYATIYPFVNDQLRQYVLRVPRSSSTSLGEFDPKALLAGTSLTTKWYLQSAPHVDIPFNAGHPIAKILTDGGLEGMQDTGITINRSQPGLTREQYISTHKTTGESGQALEERYVAAIASLPQESYNDLLFQTQALNIGKYHVEMRGDNLLLDEATQKLGFVDVTKLKDKVSTPKGVRPARNIPDAILSHIIGKDFFLFQSREAQATPAFQENCRIMVEKMIIAAETAGCRFREDRGPGTDLPLVLSLACKYNPAEIKDIYARLDKIKDKSPNPKYEIIPTSTKTIPISLGDTPETLSKKLQDLTPDRCR